MTDPAPSWASTARKALVATLVAFTVSGGVILAAVADDHVTTTEWVTIALTLGGALVGGGSVYATRNAQTSRMRLYTSRDAKGLRVLNVERQGYPTVYYPLDSTTPDRDTRPDWWTEPA